MCWNDCSDEPAGPIRVVERRRIYRTIPSSPRPVSSGSRSSYYLYQPASPRPSYTTITRTHRQTRSETLVPLGETVFYRRASYDRARPRSSVPVQIEYGSGRISPDVRIIERRGYD
ncbi:hypothetical protein BGW36DRAFT_403107 [Talaromyces proteolyticus]|uniref:Uncharacterized protein n=1 Tax=Talaromyces proteolyticus TaxID=1131652 RepID=A0AAD4Q6C3_9EURO|nr:uncharacterized protein BGW36DRAFT_403107 [Talaromyces proteolyticus]KAH8705551.1 hypothetical protein BGW36DRAFT_403107 [Talaromyces proteolyticus]